MDGYSWIALLTLIAVVLAMWKIRKRKEYQYSLLDTSGIILNIVLIVMVYPPLCVAGGLLAHSSVMTVAMARLMPALCVGGVGASVGILEGMGQKNRTFRAVFCRYLGAVGIMRRACRGASSNSTMLRR